MIDYARESTIDLYNMFYEIDDIIDMVAKEDTVGGTTTSADPVPSGGGDSGGDSSAPASSAPAEVGKPNENTNTDGEGKKNNADVKNTSGFVSTIKKLANTLIVNIKKLIVTLTGKMTKISSLGLTQFMSNIQSAKQKKGQPNAIEIVNFKYNEDSFKDKMDTLYNFLKSYDSEVETAFNEYQRVAQSQTDAETSKIKDFNKQYSGDNLYTSLAKKMGMDEIADNADFKTIKGKFQEAFRGGDKETITIDEAYAKHAEDFLNGIKNYLDRLTNTTNLTKKISQKIQDKTKNITVKPDTDSELNKDMTTFIENVAKFDLFAANFCIFASNLLTERIVNSKIILQRAWLTDGEGKSKEEEKKDDENNESEDEGEKDEDLDKAADQDTDIDDAGSEND